jgi:hypothetical protein
MTSDFDEPRKKGLLGVVVGACVLLGLFLAIRMPSGAPINLVGVVQSSGSISVAKIQGGTREAASVVLSDGNVVTAHVISGGPLSPGDKVRVLEQRRMLGSSVYQVVAKEIRY